MLTDPVAETQTDSLLSHPFLFLERGRPRGANIVQAFGVTVAHAERLKSDGTIGGFTVVKAVSFDHSKITLRPHDPINGLGRKTSSMRFTVPKTAAGIKTVMRRLRPQEAARIAAVDVEIARLVEELASKRAERRTIVQEAWVKAHVVPLAHLTIQPDRDLTR